MEKQEKEIKKLKENKKKRKRKVSIFTIFLWLFLIVTMSVITIGMFTQKNAIEVTDENWKVELMMYDRNSDTPNQPITDFTWNATNESDTRQLAMQINYTCLTGKAYAPGELQICIPSWNQKTNFSEENQRESLKVTSAIGNSDNWKYQYDRNSNMYVFTNLYSIESGENFQGSVQIVYDLKPIFKIQTDLEVSATLKENIQNADTIITATSNSCHFHYNGNKKNYTLTKGSYINSNTDYTKIDAIVNDYYWARYEFSTSTDLNIIKALDENSSPIVYNQANKCIKEVLPEGCVLYDENLDPVEATENNEYYYLYTDKFYYVRYPKSKYNEGDKITNTAELWGRYEDEEEMQKLAEDSVETTLTNLNFEYTGNLYELSKENVDFSTYQSIVRYGLQDLEWSLSPIAFYTDSIMDVEIGDDLLYADNENEDPVKLSDDDYHFTKIYIPVFHSYNKYNGSNGEVLNGYEWELQVRYAGQDEYVSYQTGVTGNSQKYIYFERKDIVGIKFIIKNLDKTLYDGEIKVFTNIHTTKIKALPSHGESSRVYNYDYMIVSTTDENGEKKILNESAYYNMSISLAEEIKESDLENFGTYLYRTGGFYPIFLGFLDFTVYQNNPRCYVTGSNEFYTMVYEYYAQINSTYYPVDNNPVIKLYDLLPKGAILENTVEEVINSISVDSSAYSNFKLKDGTTFSTKAKFNEYIRKHTTVEVVENYKNTGRVAVIINIALHDLDWTYYAEHEESFRIIGYVNAKIPYDSILEYGVNYKNEIYAMLDDEETSENMGEIDAIDYWGPSGYDSKATYDDGRIEEIMKDIDNDGITDENVVYSYKNKSIAHASSSQQSVITKVRTDLTEGEYVTGTAEVSPGEEYDYKLRVTTGANSIKDLILYDHIETIMDGSGADVSTGWKGSFLGVDTSYAESKGYAPKVYYSTELNPGKLTEVPDKWLLLDDNVDKSTVKSICVDLRYKSDGSEMELGANDVVFVLVRMQAPDDINLKTSSSNMFSTNWKAIEPSGGIIDNIEGIYSNQVNVEISKKEITTSISGQKTWIDEDNKYQTRPSSITVKLMRDGRVYTRKTVTAEDNWSYTFENVPVYKDNVGTKYEYSIEEDYVEGYIASYEGNNIINEVKLTELKGEKIWIDEDNKNNTRPKSITVRLWQDGKIYAEKTITAEDNWSYTFENLPMYRNNEKDEHEYRIEEVAVVNYITSYEGNNIINEVNLTEFEVEKIWNDNGNVARKRPESIVVELKREGSVIRKITLNEENNWKYTFKALEKYNALGEEIVYTVDEQSFVNDEWYVKEIVGGKITNKLVVSDERVKIIGSKSWDDNNNLAGKRPESVVLQVKNGDTVVTEQVVTEEDNWSYEFELAKYDENGNEIVYTIDEKEVGSKFYEKVGVEGNVVINKFVVPDEKIEIWVDKKWEDEDNKYGKRPESVILQIKNGETVVEEVEVNEENDWKHKFVLTKYDELGNEINYTVDEKETDEYYEKYIDGYTIVNTCTYTPPTDTSDISVWLYIVLAVIAVCGIGVFVFVKVKQKKNLKK